MRFGLKLLSVLASSLLLVGCVSTAPEAEEVPSIPARFENEVGVQLFMWTWNSIAAECEFLGDSGIDWVLTSPPQEHITGGSWWTVYQPVSYQIESRLGNRQEFAEMTATCADHGVDIIADAVINHMTGQDSGIGYAGTEFTKYEYPGLYNKEDFHDCGLTTSGQIQNYRDQAQVQTCELLGLSDLRTDSEKVQRAILSYLKDLLSLGVAGIRIDAAKHMFAQDLKAILDQLPDGTRVIHEVIRGSGEPIQPEQYMDSGDVWEFDYARSMLAYFRSEFIRPAASRSRFARYTPSDQTVSFVSNHDTERNGETLSYRDARYFELATAMMLAEDYGQPMLYSSYAFTSYDAGPYELVDGVVEVDCSGVAAPKTEYKDSEWICQHRWSSTVNMIGFRDKSQDLPIVEKHFERGVYGFARQNIGYFITNVSQADQKPVSVQTTLPDGEYIDLIDGGSYQIVDGLLTTTLAPMSAIALLVD